MKADRRPPNRRRSRWTLFSALVAFVFMILLATAVVSGVISYICMHVGILGDLRRGPVNIYTILASSIIIGTALTLMAGRKPLHPFRKLIAATQEIAAGNFGVRIHLGGPQELRRLSDSFNAMAEELGSIETLRSDFVSNVSHEFKTPVASIRGFAKLLRKGGLPEDKQREYLDIIIAESNRLSQLSGNVLLLSNLEGRSEIGDVASFSLDEQIRRTILLFEPQLSNKQIEIDVDLEPTQVTGNEELLQHVWVNLLGNAVKFTAPGGTIQVSLCGDENGVALSVRDDGIGMEPEVCEHLFDKFYQGDKSHATQGNGLGLSLVKRIVDLSGGTVCVSSEPSKGSSFVVRLPSR